MERTEYRRHPSKQIVIGQRFGLPPFYVDSNGYIYFETDNGKEYWLKALAFSL